MQPRLLANYLLTTIQASHTTYPYRKLLQANKYTAYLKKHAYLKLQEKHTIIEDKDDSIVYKINGKKHRTDANNLAVEPAEVVGCGYSMTFYDQYCVNDKMHRTNEEGLAVLPAYISYSEGNIEYECYCVNDEIHRTNNEGIADMPAEIYYDKKGNIEDEDRYINGIKQ